MYATLKKMGPIKCFSVFYKCFQTRDLLQKLIISTKWQYFHFNILVWFFAANSKFTGNMQEQSNDYQSFLNDRTVCKRVKNRHLIVDGPGITNFWFPIINFVYCIQICKLTSPIASRFYLPIFRNDLNSFFLKSTI